MGVENSWTSGRSAARGLGHREQEEGVVWGGCVEVGLSLGRQPQGAYVKVTALRPMEAFKEETYRTLLRREWRFHLGTFPPGWLITEGLSITILNFPICLKGSQLFNKDHNSLPYFSCPSCSRQRCQLSQSLTYTQNQAQTAFSHIEALGMHYTSIYRPICKTFLHYQPAWSTSEPLLKQASMGTPVLHGAPVGTYS